MCADIGELYSFGCNDEGQLGFDSGSEERIAVPTQVTLPTEKTCIKMLSAGVYHSACLTGMMLFCYILIGLFALTYDFAVYNVYYVTEMYLVFISADKITSSSSSTFNFAELAQFSVDYTC